MVKIRIKATNEIKEVMRNEAHDLIDRGLAVMATVIEKYKVPSVIEPPARASFDYSNRQMQPSIKGGKPGFKTKALEDDEL